MLSRRFPPAQAMYCCPHVPLGTVSQAEESLHERSTPPQPKLGAYAKFPPFLGYLPHSNDEQSKPPALPGGNRLPAKFAWLQHARNSQLPSWRRRWVWPPSGGFGSMGSPSQTGSSGKSTHSS